MSYDPIPAADRLEAAFAARDMAGLEAIWSPDIRYTGPAGSSTGLQARAAGERVWLDAFPDVRIEQRHRLVAGDTVIMEGTIHGTHTGPLASPVGVVPPTGRTIEGVYVSIMQFRDDRVVDQRVYYDQFDLLRQLGLAQGGGR